MSDATTRLKSVINTRTGVKIYRFPENIGSSTLEPESRKFCLFRFHNVDENGNQGRTTKCVVLPFPEINDAINVKYDNVEFDVVGAIAVGAAAGNITVDRLSTIAKTGVQSFNKNSFSRIAADTVLSGTPGLKAGVAKGLNSIQNPYISNVFNSTGFRDFSFSFVLIPKRDIESQNIQDIITTFKTAMLPEKKLVKHGERNAGQPTGILTMPDKVDVTFFPTTEEYKRNESIIKITNAVVSDFTVEFSAGTQNPTFFKETDAPLSATLSVSVKETEIYTKERLVKDYPQYREDFKE